MKDACGMELAVGDAVHIKVGMEWVLAHVIKIQNGGIAVTGVPKDKNSPVGITPDALVLQVGIALTGHPGHPQGGVIKLAAKNQVELIADASVKM